MISQNQPRRRMPASIPALRAHLELLHESDPDLAGVVADAYAALKSAQVVTFAAFPELDPGTPPHHKIVTEVYQTISRDLAAVRLDPPGEDQQFPEDLSPIGEEHERHDPSGPLDEGDEPPGADDEPAGYTPRD
jgi:hypothetical protein